MPVAGFKRDVGQSFAAKSRLILVWSLAALLGFGLLYLALPLLAFAGLFFLGLFGGVVLACMGYRVTLFFGLPPVQ